MMKILHVAAKMFPLLKTGGLADVVGALPLAQQAQGQDVRLLLPAFPAITAALPDCPIVAQFDSFAGEVTLRYGQYLAQGQTLGIYLLDVPSLYAREGNPYHDDDYRDYADNYLRFALLGYVAAEIADGRDAWWQPEVVHVHDWHAGLACAYIKQKDLPVKTLFTVHNIAYQGLFDARHLSEIALPHSYFHVDGLEFHGQLSYLKAGIFYADEVTTVSPTFAREITQADNAHGLHGLLQARAEQGRLHGILNGLDEAVWNPESDPCLSAHYKIGAMQGKAANKKRLQQQFKLHVEKTALLFVMVTRLTEQKGVDLLLESIDKIIQKKGQIIVLGSGAPEFEQALLRLAERYPEQIGVFIGYDEDLAHRIIAGGDVIVIPSRFEPCGLTQLYGLKYGTLPLVRRTGGLADTVTNMEEETFRARTATGFVFDGVSSEALNTAIKHAQTLWKTPRKWSSVRANAMREDFTWHLVAEKYAALYAQV